MFDSSYMKFLEVKFVETESKKVAVGVWGKEEWGVTTKQSFRCGRWKSPSGDGGTIWMYLLPQNCILKNGKLYVVCILLHIHKNTEQGLDECLQKKKKKDKGTKGLEKWQIMRE